MNDKVLRAAFIGPLGGAALGPGMVTMANEVDGWKRPGWFIEGKFFPWENWQQAGDWVASADRRAVVGYSNGGNAADWVATYDEYREPVGLDLLVGLDPTLWLPCPAIKPNVAKAHCYYNGNYVSNWKTIGHSWYTLAAGNTVTKLTTETIYDWHGNVDTNPARQKAVLAMITDLMKENGNA